jgi:hypothetical protein
MSNHSRPTAQNGSLPASTVRGGRHVGPVFDALLVHLQRDAEAHHLGVDWTETRLRTHAARPR